MIDIEKLSDVEIEDIFSKIRSAVINIMREPQFYYNINNSLDKKVILYINSDLAKLFYNHNIWKDANILNGCSIFMGNDMFIVENANYLYKVEVIYNL